MHQLVSTAVSMGNDSELPAGLDGMVLLTTVLYAVLGVLLLMLFAWLINLIFKLDLRRELIEDQNPGLGLAFAGTAIAIAIIIAATIVS